MPERIELSASPQNLKISKGESAESNITLRNKGQTVDQFTISVEGLDPKLYTLPVSSVALFPNDQDNVKIIIHLPEVLESAERSHSFKVKATSQENPADVASITLTVSVGAAPKLAVSITPGSINARKGTYQIGIDNPDNREAKVQLKGVSSKSRVRFDLQPGALNVPPGGHADAAVNIKLHWLALLWGEKAYDFQIVADQPGATGVQEASSASAQIISVPWYRIFSQLRIPWLSKPPSIKTFKASTDNKREFKLNWEVQRSNRVKLDDGDVEPRGETLVQPSENKQYVLTATNRYGTSTKTLEVKPLSVPKAQASDKMKVSLSPVQLQTQAGLIPAQAMVQVQNLSDIVDKFIVSVEGMDESWYSRSASSIALMPQASDQVQISFLPPKKKGAKSGIYPFAITVRSQTNTQEMAVVLGQLEILPATEFKVKVTPFRVTGMRKGTYRINLSNVNVTGANITLEASDLEDGCRFQIKPEKLMLGAWNTVDIPLIVRPKRGSTIGEIKRFDITINANMEGSTNPLTGNCEFNHKPFMKSWKPIWRLIKLIIVLVILFVAIYFILKAGGGWSAFKESPSNWFNNITETIENWFVK